MRKKKKYSIKFAIHLKCAQLCGYCGKVYEKVRLNIILIA